VAASVAPVAVTAVPVAPAATLAASAAPAAPGVAGSVAVPAPKRALMRIDWWLEWSFRIGLATVFLINAVTAITDPSGFLKLLQHNFVAQIVGHYQVLLYVIAVNDFILGLLILLGFARRYVLAWAGVWLMIVTFFKATSLV
jgi:uncharacterized membrane protein YphA (DoxX/SURF4 family)